MDAGHISPRLSRLCNVVGVFAPAAFVAAMVSFLANGSAFGIDFAVFHLGGRTVRDAGFDSVYDRDGFRSALAEDVPGADVADSLTYFISPPPWAWIFQPLSAIDYPVALGLWLAVGVLGLLYIVDRLDLPWMSLVLLVASPAFVMNTAIGQSGVFFLVLGVLVHRACASDSPVRAGLLLGLFVLKPPLAIGWVLWWLLDFSRWHRALTAAGFSAAVVSLPTLVDGGSAWTAYVGVLTERVADEGSLRVNSPSFAEFVKLLLPGASPAVTLVGWALAMVVGVSMLRFAQRRFDSLAAMSGAAVLATLASSPHLSIYDTGLIVIPIAVLAQQGVLNRDRLMVLWALYVAGIVFGPLWYELQAGVLGRGVGLEFLTLLAIAALSARWLNAGQLRYSRMREPSTVSAST